MKKRIETPRLLLIPPDLSHAQEMFRNWASDPLVTRHLTWQPHADVQETKAILQSWQEDASPCGRYHRLLFLKELGEVIGSIDLVRRESSNPTGEVGYALGQSWWGRGLMTEALQAFLEALFADGFLQVNARHSIENPASGRVMQKAFMKLDCIEKSVEKDRPDMVYYSLLATDFSKIHDTPSTKKSQ